MLIDSEFHYSIPTKIRFTLNKFNIIDNLIISQVSKECKNYNPTEGQYLIKVEDFKKSLLSNRRLKYDIENRNSLSEDNSFSSVAILWKIIEKFKNLEFISFNVSLDEKFTRLAKLENKNFLVFNFKIDQGTFDLTKIFDIHQLKVINKRFIELGYISNKYLLRNSYFYIPTVDCFDILAELEIEGLLSTLDILDTLDPKLEDDNPILLVKTDYSLY
jgi:hypothetical protein